MQKVLVVRLEVIMLYLGLVTKRNEPKRWIFDFVVALIFSFYVISPNALATNIKVAVFSDHYSTIQSAIKNNSCPDTNEVDFGENQMLAEYLLLCNALKLGGLDANLILVDFPVIDRVLGALSKEEVLISGFGVWQQDALSANLTTSIELMAPYKFTKGLYTTKQKANTLNNSFDPSKLIAVANQNWENDWQALKCSRFNVLHVNQYQQMFNLVELGRADILPLTFGAGDELSRNVFGISLYPLKGVKIAFKDSLNFAVNVNSLKGAQLLETLNLGLAMLKGKGKIDNMYYRLGLYNETVDNWKEIGC